MTNETNGQAIITVQQLRRANACEDQMDLFQQVWGDRVDVEEEEFLKHAAEFDWGWGADALLLQQGGRYFRYTEESWYRVWVERSTEYAKSTYDTYRALKLERREKAEAADGKYDEVYDSYENPIEAAREAYQKSQKEGQAIWFARLYREACGITTDEWQIKERESDAAGTADGNAVSDSAAQESPNEAAGPIERDEDLDAGGSFGIGDSADTAAPTNEPATEG